MANDTQVKQEAPERVWLTVFTDDQSPRFVMMEWQSPVVRNTQPGDFVATRPHHKIAYVPESLLATVRRDEKEAERRRLALVIQSLPATSAGAGAFKQSVIAALEASANSEPDEPRPAPWSKQSEAGRAMNRERALGMFRTANQWLYERIAEGATCDCGNCYLCAYNFFALAPASPAALRDEAHQFVGRTKSVPCEKCGLIYSALAHHAATTPPSTRSKVSAGQTK